jgi:hypothetical protein
LHNKIEFELNYKDVNVDSPTSLVDEVFYDNDSGTNSPTESDIKYGITSKESPKLYNTFFNNENSGLSNAIKYRKGFNYKFEYNTKISEHFLEGDL